MRMVQEFLNLVCGASQTSNKRIFLDFLTFSPKGTSSLGDLNLDYAALEFDLFKALQAFHTFSDVAGIDIS